MRSSIEIRRLYSLDLPGASDEPEDPTDCWVRVNADIGPTDSQGADTFRLVVCTPKAIDRRLAKSRVVWGAQLLVLSSFDWKAVRAALIEKIGEVEAASSSWDEFVRSFGRSAAWEFEEFRE